MKKILFAVLLAAAPASAQEKKGQKAINSPIIHLSGTGHGGGSQDAAPLTPPSASSPFAKAATYVSNSPTGPWVKDAPVCNTGTVYSRTTGVDQTKPPKGCASPAVSDGCLKFEAHRTFLPTEWVDKTTIQTVVKGSDYPPGQYGIYLSYSAKDITRIGVVTLKNCAPPALKCGWTSPDFVIGPCNGPNCSNPPCGPGNRGEQGRGGGGLWTCTCQ